MYVGSIPRKPFWLMLTVAVCPEIKESWEREDHIPVLNQVLQRQFKRDHIVVGTSEFCSSTKTTRLHGISVVEKYGSTVSIHVRK